VSRLLYVAACLLAPLAWGLVAFAVTRWLEKKLPRRPPDDQTPRRPDLEYYL
jgi:hypothetical protein